MKRISFSAAYIALFLVMTSCSSKTNGEGSSIDTLAAQQPASLDKPSASKPTALDDSWATLGNMEMVMYCLPYPKADFKEDFKTPMAKGEHLLVANDQSGSIVFVGAPTELNKAEYLDQYRKHLEKRTGNALLRVEDFDDGFSVMWQQQNKGFAVRKWVRESDGETVTAEFTYDSAQAARYENWFKLVAGQTSICD